MDNLARKGAIGMNYSSIPAVLKIDSTRRPHRKTNPGRKEFGQILKQELLTVEKKVLSGKSSAEELGKEGKTSLKSEALYTNDYTVKRGDTLWGIAAKMKNQLMLSASIPDLVEKIATTNNIVNPSLILTGQNLNLTEISSVKETVNVARRSGASFYGKALNPVSEKINASEDLTFPDNLRPPAEKGTLSSSSLPVAAKMLPARQSGSEKKGGLEWLRIKSKRFIALIKASSKRQRVDPMLSQAIARAESGLNHPLASEAILDPNAVNPDGKSFGIFQLIHDTGHRFHQLLGLKVPYNPFSANQNIQIGIGYLQYLDQIFSRESILTEGLNTTAVEDISERKKFQAAAFNAGEGSVARAQQRALLTGKDPSLFENVKPHLPTITQNYVDKVNLIISSLRSYTVRS